MLSIYNSEILSDLTTSDCLNIRSAMMKKSGAANVGETIKAVAEEMNCTREDARQAVGMYVNSVITDEFYASRNISSAMMIHSQ